MLGAIIGDIAGSRFEFNNYKSKNFALFGGDGLAGGKVCFTDDTVMTVAVAAALLATRMEAREATRMEAREATRMATRAQRKGAGAAESAESGKSEENFKRILTGSMHYYGARYPHAGYGGRFGYWLESRSRQPYNSFGNGAAMRVSPAAWVADSLKESERLAALTAGVTHDHPEGIKGAQATAAAIWLARNGSTKQQIREYIEERYYPRSLKRTLAEIRPGYTFDETCQGTVPEAIISFLESENFEDAIRCAVSLGGDSDTLAAITGSIAEAFYGIPEETASQALALLDEELYDVTSTFYREFCGDRQATDKRQISDR